jgi:hypothetical protein
MAYASYWAKKISSDGFATIWLMTQQEALDILKTGVNVFLTGPAGSGKTHVLRQYIEYLKGLGVDLGITASTGIAATHMGGVTIHSWSGIGIKDYLSENDIDEISEKQYVKSRVKDAKVLVIDEVSMLHHFRLDLVDAVLKRVKNSIEPFGGMQVVFCGDFFQLPPIRRGGERESFFAYHSESWKNLGLKVCYLLEQHRQNDSEYLKVLNAIRDAKVGEETRQILKTRFNTHPTNFKPTKLYSHNKDVDSENNSELEKVASKIFEYHMESRGRGPLVESLKKSCLAPEKLRLKVGAKVMFVKNNFEEGYVNGTLGTVIKCGFEQIQVRTIADKVIDVPKESWHIEEDGKIKAEISQYPLRLAWAITVHKSQGMSLDCAEVDLSSSFEKGMGYVALSRVRTLEGLYLKGLNDMALKVDEEVLEFDKRFRELSEHNSAHIRTLENIELAKMHSDFLNLIENSIPKVKKLDTLSETKILLDEGLSIKDIANRRGLKVGTVIDHIERIKSEDPKYNIYNLKSTMPQTRFKAIYSAFQKVGVSEGGSRLLGPVKELLGPKYSYEDIRLVRLFL